MTSEKCQVEEPVPLYFSCKFASSFKPEILVNTIAPSLGFQDNMTPKSF